MRLYRDPRRFDDLAEGYDFLASLERNSEFFLEHLPERRENALDVGCGTGILAVELANHFKFVLAVDVSEPMLELARRKRPALNLEYRWGDANALEIEGSFDAIVSHTTLHHLLDVPRTLVALRERLALGGRLILIDNVSERGMIPKYVYVLGAFVSLPFDLLEHGCRAAWRLFRFRVSPAWLAHLASDRYVSEREFRELYERALPGACFTRLKHFMGVVWEREAV